MQVPADFRQVQDSILLVVNRMERLCPTEQSDEALAFGNVKSVLAEMVEIRKRLAAKSVLQAEQRGKSFHRNC